MPVLKTLVEPEIKKRFRAIAKSKKMSESKFLRAVISVVTEQDDEVSEANARPVEPDADNTEIDRMTVRMPRFLMDGVKARAKLNDMAPSRWVTALVQSNLTEQPVMTETELAALQASNRELAAIGRNINQIAKALNEAFYETERLKLDKLAELSQAIEETRTVIRALVRASQNSWKAD